MSKAYDRIEWGFLRNIMLKMGFQVGWVDMIMRCVSSVSYKLVHDGQEVGPIFPKGGLHQGNPLSPYLFILFAEGLSALLHDMENKKMIQGCKVARGASSISHLLFLDDSYLFFKASLLQCNYLKNYLQVYEKALGQRVNFDKSSFCDVQPKCR